MTEIALILGANPAIARAEMAAVMNLETKLADVSNKTAGSDEVTNLKKKKKTRKKKEKEKRKRRSREKKKKNLLSRMPMISNYRKYNVE